MGDARLWLSLGNWETMVIYFAAKRKAFEEKRKHHYNEFLEAKRLQEMQDKNEDADEEETAADEAIKTSGDDA